MLGQMFGCHHSYVCRTIQRKTSIRYRKKGYVPGRTPQQKSAVRPKCSALVKIFRKKKVVMDDESFFYLSDFDISGNKGYYASNVDETPDDIKRTQKSLNMSQSFWFGLPYHLMVSPSPTLYFLVNVLIRICTLRSA